MPNLSKVYDSCEMTQAGVLQFAIGYQWTNGLFYIDNAECTWKLFGIIPIVSIFSEETGLQINDLGNKYTTQQLRERYNQIQQEFESINEEFALGKISQENYVSALESLVKHEMDLFQDVKEHTFERDEITEYNFWYRDVMKFPTTIEQEIAKHISEDFGASEITSRYEKYLDENNELNFALQYDKNGIIIDDLQRIFDWCDYTGEKPAHWYFDWNNQTHRIDSNNCRLIKTDKVLIEHMKNAVFDKVGGHYDYLPINDNPNMMSMEKIELLDNNSINVEFGQNNYKWSTGYKPIPEFEYHANFRVNDTFVVLCTNIEKDGYADAHPDLSEPYLPGLGIVKYLGPITVENEPILLFWHESASIQVDVPCSYPEMIYHSINLWELRENGLPTDSLENALGSNYQKSNLNENKN